MHLTVKSPFTLGDKEYARGDKITDEALVDEILHGKPGECADYVHHVVKTADPAEAFNGKHI